MATRRWTMGVALALVAVLALAVVLGGLGEARQEPGHHAQGRASSPTSAASTTRASTLWRTRASSDAKKQLGIEGRVYISKSAGDYVPNLSTAARQGHDLVIANGFLLGDSLAAVAKRFPDTKFAIIDFPVGRL